MEIATLMPRSMIRRNYRRLNSLSQWRMLHCKDRLIGIA